MGLFLTLLYILTAYLAPQTLWGPLADYHIEIVLAGLATIASLPGLGRARLGSMPQTWAVFGMIVAVFLSMLFTGWLGSVPAGVLSFIPNIFVFFLIVINCRRRMHLQLLVAVLLVVCLNTIARGAWALHTGNLTSPYLMGQGGDEDAVVFNLYRLRGMAFINDPNDFAQVLASLVPCMFLFWRRGQGLRNAALVLAPVAVLIYGMYLTHSRGGMVALLAVILLASRKKIGTVAASLLTGLGFAAAMVAGWSGGRDVSVEAGSDRLEAWSTGLELIKSHPLFGVGYLRFGEYYYITAHNTIVVCAAELGLFGLFWWLMFVFPTIRDAVVAARGDEQEIDSEARDEIEAYAMAYGGRPSAADANAMAASAVDLRWAPAGYGNDATNSSGTVDSRDAAAEEIALQAGNNDAVPMHLRGVESEEEQLEPEEIQRIAALMPVCLAGYFVAGWFLSRAYIMTLFIYGGMVQVIYGWALSRNLAAPRMPFPKIAQYAAMLAVVLILVVYAMLRVQHLLGHF